jgi:hypothetical protein
MRGDRVRITSRTGTMVEAENTSEMVFVYAPKIDPVTKQFMKANDGSVIVESLGGVNVGSTGTIQGNPIMVHKTQLKDFEGVVGLGNNDVVPLYPVFLDKYQRDGWFPGHHVKIMAGGVAQ